MSKTSPAHEIPLNIILQSAEKLILHNEFETAKALLQAVTAYQPQYSFAHALLDSICPPKQIEQPQPKYYVDMDHHTGLFEVLRMSDDERIRLFTSREEAEDFVKING